MLLDNAKVTAVVGMQYPIDAGPALAFCIAFYQELLSGKHVGDAVYAHVGDAVYAGRKAAGEAYKLDKNFVREFGVPVLYMRSKEGVLLKLRKAPKPQEAPPQGAKLQQVPPLSLSSEGKLDMGNDHHVGYSKQQTSDLRVEVQPRLETAHIEHTLQAALKPTEIRDRKPVIRYFVSYAHDDKNLKDKLLKPLKQHLAIAKDYCFEAWDDSEILAGEHWHERIQAAIAHCQFGLLLVTPAFLGSTYIQDHELRAFVASNLVDPEPGKWAIPVALKPIPFDGSIDLKGLEQLQVFRDGAEKAFNACSTSRTRDKFALELFQQILKIVKRYAPSPILTLNAGRNDDQGQRETS